MAESTVQLLVALVVALVVVGFVVWPMVSKRRGVSSEPTAVVDSDRVEARIADYRRALRRRTVCRRCLYANPDDSRFCAQCGERLPAADAAGADVANPPA